MKNMSTEMYYNELKGLTKSELEVIKTRCADELSRLYHDMGRCIGDDDQTKFNLLNNQSINTHNQLNACIILINHKDEGLI